MRPENNPVFNYEPERDSHFQKAPTQVNSISQKTQNTTDSAVFFNPKLTANPLQRRRLTDIPCSIRFKSRMETFESKLPLQSVITSCPPPSSLWSQPDRECYGGNQVEQGHSHPTFFPSRLKQSPSSSAGSDTRDKKQEHLQSEKRLQHSHEAVAGFSSVVRDERMSRSLTTGDRSSKFKLQSFGVNQGKLAGSWVRTKNDCSAYEMDLPLRAA